MTKKYTIRQHISENNLHVDFVAIGFLSSVFLIAFIATPIYFIFNPPSWGHLAFLAVSYWLTGLGITMGYHRLFSHKTFEAHPILKFVLLCLGALSLQNSALKWSSDHRIHHQYTDTPKDPYNINLGFWWAHILWIFFKSRNDQRYKEIHLGAVEKLKSRYPNSKDLINDPMVVWQHWLYGPLAFIMSFAIPGLIGYFVGDFWGYLLVGGFLRLALVYNSTFFINSLAHILGKSHHNENISAKDSFLCALLSFGEGYHNYHHAYPNDYRNGVKAYQFDPTKWLIWLGSKVRLTWNLKRQATS